MFGLQLRGQLQGLKGSCAGYGREPNTPEKGHIP